MTVTVHIIPLQVFFSRCCWKTLVLSWPDCCLNALIVSTRRNIARTSLFLLIKPLYEVLNDHIALKAIHIAQFVSSQHRYSSPFAASLTRRTQLHCLIVLQPYSENTCSNSVPPKHSLVLHKQDIDSTIYCIMKWATSAHQNHS